LLLVFAMIGAIVSCGRVTGRVHRARFSSTVLVVGGLLFSIALFIALKGAKTCRMC